MTLEEKIYRDMPLSAPELREATGYGRRALQKIKPPLVCKKIRLTDFWRHVHTLQNCAPVTIGTPEIKPNIDSWARATAKLAWPEPSNDPPLGEDIQNELRNLRVRPISSPNLSGLPPRSIE